MKKNTGTGELILFIIFSEKEENFENRRLIHS